MRLCLPRGLLTVSWAVRQVPTDMFRTENLSIIKTKMLGWSNTVVEPLSSRHQADSISSTRGKMFTKGVTRTSAPHSDTVRVWIRADFRAGSL